jgi:hypothetical protein
MSIGRRHRSRTFLCTTRISRLNGLSGCCERTGRGRARGPTASFYVRRNTTFPYRAD